jgi:hypothetical protein
VLKPQEEQVVQEDTGEVVPVALMDLRAEGIDILHLYMPIHHLRGFHDRYIHISRGEAKTSRRTSRTGAGSATGPILGVQERLFGTGTRIPCRLEFARLLFNQVSEQALRGTKGNAQTQNMDFIKKVGKMNIPTFDGSP